jgi:hypothetical protein
MKKRALIYFSRSKALKIMERPLSVDLKTLLSATFAVSKSRVVKKHIKQTLMKLDSSNFQLSA